jgi:hypothetical protein
MFMGYEFPMAEGCIVRYFFFTEYEFPTKDGQFIMYGISVLLKYFYQLWPTCLDLKFAQLHIELD